VQEDYTHHLLPDNAQLIRTHNNYDASITCVMLLLLRSNEVILGAVSGELVRVNNTLVDQSFNIDLIIIAFTTLKNL
jgi:hypothetical protein